MPSTTKRGNARVFNTVFFKKKKRIKARGPQRSPQKNRLAENAELDSAGKRYAARTLLTKFRISATAW